MIITLTKDQAHLLWRAGTQRMREIEHSESFSECLQSLYKWTRTVGPEKHMQFDMSHLHMAHLLVGLTQINPLFEEAT